MEKMIFISHRHADSQIAKCIYETLLQWKIHSSNIFVSSVPESAAQSGNPVESEIIAKIKQSGLMIIVLTDPSEDWEYVTMEYGIAKGIEKDEPNIVVFECGGRSHKLFNNINIKVSKNYSDDIRKFTYELHKHDNYINGVEAIGKDMDENSIKGMAEDFHKKISEQLPDVKANVLHRWPLMVLTLPADSIKILNNLDEYNDAEKAKKIIYDSATVTIRRGPVEPIFGLGVPKDRGSLWNSYVTQWQTWYADEDKPNPSDEWIDALHLELFKAIKERPPNRLEKRITRPGEEKEYLFSFPRMKRYADGRMDFDIYIYPHNYAPGK